MFGPVFLIFFAGVTGSFCYSSEYHASENVHFTVLHSPNLATYCWKYCSKELKNSKESLSKNCYCECPKTFESSHILYPIFMYSELLKADALLLNGNEVNNLEYYCPRLVFKENVITITAWNNTLTATTKSLYHWNSYKNVIVDSPGGNGIKATFGRMYSDPRGYFYIFTLCLDGGATYWVVHSPTTKPLSYANERLSLRILKGVGYDTAKIYRPNYSKCGKSYYEDSY